MTKMTILIAGTSSSYLEISKKMLKFHNEACDVDFAYSCKECVEKATSEDYQLVLFDYNLGDENGLEIIDALQAAGVECPLIIMIDEGDEVKAIKALERGAHDYILKNRGYLTTLPFTIRSIIEKSAANQPDFPSSTEVYEQITAAGPVDSFLILDKKGRILSASEEIQRITNFSEDELLQLSFTDLLPQDNETSFFNWLNRIGENGQTPPAFMTEVINKKGERINLEITFTPIRDEFRNVQSYRGRISLAPQKPLSNTVNKDQIDQLEMVTGLSQLMTSCYDDPLSLFLDKIAEFTSQIFRFKRATIALLDPRKKVFIKQAMVGYGSFPVTDKQNIEVPLEVIQRVFTNRFRVKVIYYNQDFRNIAGSLNSKFPERRMQKRRPAHQWHKRDLVLVNLRNRQGETFGYISLDRPGGNFIPGRDTFYNLELLGQLLAFAIENYHQFSTQERRVRRFKQILVTSNIFKLHLSLNELLKEVVWSVRFSTDFNLIALGLISSRTGDLEIKAAACEDKIKSRHLLNIHLPLHELSCLLRDEYGRGRSYFVNREEQILQPMKNIYYGHKIYSSSNGKWPAWGLLLVPIKSREGKIIGVIFADDPASHRLPDDDEVNSLEIIANRIAIAIDNRILYIKAQHKNGKPDRENQLRHEFISELRATRAKHRFVDRFFK